MSESAVLVHDVSKRFRLYRERNQSFKATAMRGRRSSYDELWALRNISLEVAPGRTFGLIGDNGSGKSTLLKCLAKILVPDRGQVQVRGRVAALLELGSGFHPELTGRQNVYLNGTILGLSRRELERRFDDIVAFAGLEQAIDQPVKNYSSGMYARLGFAVATSVDPEVLLIDEVLAVGDATFQRRCAERISELRGQGRTIVLVSHASDSIRALCDEVLWLEKGRAVGQGPTSAVLDRYLRAGVVERPEVAGDAERWGAGGLVIEHVEIDAGTGPTTRLVAGAPAWFRIRVRNDGARTEPPVLGLGIWSVDGMHLWGANTAGQGLDIPAVAPGSQRTMEFTTDRLPLQPGTYDLEVALVDRSLGHTFDHLRRAVRFDVQQGRSHESGGYVSLGGQFTV